MKRPQIIHAQRDTGNLGEETGELEIGVWDVDRKVPQLMSEERRWVRNAIYPSAGKMLDSNGIVGEEVAAKALSHHAVNLRA